MRFFAIYSDAIDGFFDPYRKVAPDEVETCPCTGTWSVGKGAKEHEGYDRANDRRLTDE